MPDHTVSVMRCTKCGTLDPSQRDLCAKCHGRLAPHEVPGAGTLVSWTMIRRPPTAFKADGQYAVAVVRLDAGVQVTGRLAEPDERIKPGARLIAKGRVHSTTEFELA